MLDRNEAKSSIISNSCILYWANHHFAYKHHHCIPYTDVDSKILLLPMHNYPSFQHLLLFIYLFHLVLRPFQDYFSSYEMGQSVGGRKRENPREKTPGTPASRTWLVSHVASAGLEPAPDTAVR